MRWSFGSGGFGSWSFGSWNFGSRSFGSWSYSGGLIHRWFGGCGFGRCGFGSGLDDLADAFFDLIRFARDLFGFLFAGHKGDRRECESKDGCFHN